MDFYEIEIAPGTVVGSTLDGHRAAGRPAAAIGAAVLARYEREAHAAIQGMRDAVDAPPVQKAEAYKRKLAIARDLDNASAEALDLFDREAAARGLDRAGLAALVIAKDDAYGAMLAALETAEAEAVSAIQTIDPEAPDVEAQASAALGAALAAAQAEIAALAA